jgi:CDP-paratose synthetase
VKSILITGATGFIGRHLVPRLLSEGYYIYITLTENEINPFPKDVKVIVANNNNIEGGREIFRQYNIDGIIHLAAYVQSYVHDSLDISKLINSNILFGTQILDYAAEANVSWFINTGTYWQNYQKLGYSPVNLYAATKQAFEDIARYYIETNRITFCTIRLFDTYGPNDTRPKIFNLWNKVARSGEVINMSPGDQLIDISYIDDIIDAYILLKNQLFEKSRTIKNGSIFTLMAEKRYSLKELARIFEETTGKKLNINWGGQPYREREVMIPWESGMRLPGWEPKISIIEGIRKLSLINREC